MTTIATPPPTEIDSNSQMPPTSVITKKLIPSTHKPLYLIVATALSPPLGIGNKGDLPWPQLRTDMAYFRKVTSNTIQTNESTKSTARNAVIMGRKTWDSIPERFRPLGGRINVILTRGNEEVCLSLANSVKDELGRKSKSSATTAAIGDADGYIVRSSYRSRENDSENHASLIHVQPSNSSIGDVIVTNSLHAAADANNYISQTDSNDESRMEVNEMFCIGGAQIYGMILKDEKLRKRARVLQTLVRRLDDHAFECDTFWPEKMENGVNGWRAAGDEEVKKWTGTDLPQGDKEWVKDERANVEIRVFGWDRE